MKRRISDFRRANASRLRASQTDAEQKLWRALDRVPTFRTHFRRQVPLGSYIADFACLAARLVIELDGGQHAEEAQAHHDAVRTKWLEREGYRVVRFWNDDVLSDIESVLDTIYAAMYGSTEPYEFTPPRRLRRRPSPSRGG
ncbi:endonuclease domain-containing protein [Terrarubrum flagellatum]|uniref:endonuclease domain-containing protein n=1 Tax=Terrirubrum flagellatum TaxID=2895980 RepID=UPI00314521E4